MTYIKKVTVSLVIAIVLLFCPSVCYGDSLQQVLNQDSLATMEQENEETLFADIGKILSVDLDLMEEKLSTIKVELQEAREQVVRREKGQRIADATYNVASPGVGWCAAWVSMCYQSAGFGYPGGNADDMYWNFCHSSNRDDLVPGMIIAVPSHTQSGYAGLRYGHVGIIIERDGQWYVRDNIGYVNERPLDEWITYYGTTYTPQWGFAGDI